MRFGTLGLVCLAGSLVEVWRLDRLCAFGLEQVKAFWVETGLYVNLFVIWLRLKAGSWLFVCLSLTQVRLAV